MLKIFIAILLFSTAATVFAQNKTDNQAQAKLFLESLAKKDFQTAYNLFADEVKAALPAEVLPQVWAQITGEYGEFHGIKEFKKTTSDGVFTSVLEFSKKTENFTFAFNNQGKITGFRLAPPTVATGETAKYETPKYADTNSFTESEVTVGAGEWALPATLTMPKDKKNVPAVVLVHGSGPGDRDETAQNPANKVFKDLAWGLASKGIAVLRYDKRTRVHGGKFVALKNFTVNEETVDDALLAVELLRKTPNVDAKNIFLLGHSLGGYLIPRIAERDKKIAGFISLAGGVQPLEDIILEQNIYLASLDGNVSNEEQTAIDGVKKTVAEIKNLKAADAAAGGSYFGLPKSYWFDLQSYKPLAIAEKMTQPMLILQGESDFQVTMKDFEMSKAALGGRKSATFKSYPNLTHYFMERSGANKPNLSDYKQAGHVSETVINDIAAWILKTANR